MPEFDLTPEGYQKAKKWLEENNLLCELEKELSTDGYTLVNLANHLFQKKMRSSKKIKTCRPGIFVN